MHLRAIVHTDLQRTRRVCQSKASRPHVGSLSTTTWPNQEIATGSGSSAATLAPVATSRTAPLDRSMYRPLPERATAEFPAIELERDLPSRRFRKVTSFVSPMK